MKKIDKGQTRREVRAACGECVGACRGWCQAPVSLAQPHLQMHRARASTAANLFIIYWELRTRRDRSDELIYLILGVATRFSKAGKNGSQQEGESAGIAKDMDRIGCKPQPKANEAVTIAHTSKAKAMPSYVAAIPNNDLTG